MLSAHAQGPLFTAPRSGRFPSGSQCCHSRPEAGSKLRVLHQESGRCATGTGGSRHGAGSAPEQGSARSRSRGWGAGDCLRMNGRTSRKCKQPGLVFICFFEKRTHIFAVVVTKGTSCVECESDSCGLTRLRTSRHAVLSSCPLPPCVTVS